MTNKDHVLVTTQASNDRVGEAVYYGMMRFAEDDPEVLSLDHQLHLAKVLRGNYVYLGEGSSLEEWAADHCDVVIIPEYLPGVVHTYNVYTPAGSPLTRPVDTL